MCWTLLVSSCERRFICARLLIRVHSADPEVAALSTLTNVQNSLFVPNLGNWVNRMPTYTLSPPSSRDESSTETEEGETAEMDMKQTRPMLVHRLSSVLDEAPERRFAVLPEEMTLEGWTKEELEELNDRVRHMLHSRRSAFKRSMVGFGKYVSKRKSLDGMFRLLL